MKAVIPTGARSGEDGVACAQDLLVAALAERGWDAYSSELKKRLDRILGLER